MNKQLVARMIIERGGLLPLDFAVSMAKDGVLLQEFEDKIDGFSVEKFMDDLEYNES